MIDLGQFSKNEKTGEYEVEFVVRGRIRTTIQAESDADARAKARAMMNEDDFGIELDELDDIDCERIRKSPPMYRVTREGKIMQVSHPQDGDLPREPDERGF